MLFPLSHSTYTCTWRTLLCRREHADNEAQFAFDVMFVEFSVHLYLFALDALKARAGGCLGAEQRAEPLRAGKDPLSTATSALERAGFISFTCSWRLCRFQVGIPTSTRVPAALTEAPSSPGPEKRESRGKTLIVRLYLSMALGPQVNNQPILSACLSSRVLVPKQKRTPVIKYETGKLTPKN